MALPPTPSMPTFMFGTELALIGSPGLAQRSKPMTGTPINEIRTRADAVRATLVAQMPQPPAVDATLTAPERDVALEVVRDFEPTLKDVFFAISALSKSIVVREEI